MFYSVKQLLVFYVSFHSLVYAITTLSSRWHIFLFLVGQYASVGDIHFSNESFAIEARWNRPYHLDGVPPTNYSCTVSILSTGEDLNAMVDHENTSCSFMLEEDMICDVLVIEVMAYNRWLAGDVERAHWSLGGE